MPEISTLHSVVRPSLPPGASEQLARLANLSGVDKDQLPSLINNKGGILSSQSVAIGSVQSVAPPVVLKVEEKQAETANLTDIVETKTGSELNNKISAAPEEELKKVETDPEPQQQVDNLEKVTPNQTNSSPEKEQLVLEAQNSTTSPLNFSIPLDGLVGLQIVDERNKRGRPPKKPKTAEVEQREKELLQQKIIMQVQ